MILLGELIPLIIQRQRQVYIAGDRVLQLLIERYLAHCRLNQISTSYNFGHALKSIIHHHRQIISEQTVTATDNKIFLCQRRVSMQFAE